MIQSKAEINLANAVSKYIDKKYKLGEVDCLKYLLDIYESFGVQFPEEWHGWTRENYVERWLKGEGQEEFYLFLHEQGVEIEELKNIQRGDLVIIRGYDGGIVPAIFVGNNNLLVVFLDAGCCMIPVRAVKDRIFEIRRLTSG